MTLFIFLDSTKFLAQKMELKHRVRAQCTDIDRLICKKRIMNRRHANWAKEAKRNYLGACSKEIVTGRVKWGLLACAGCHEITMFSCICFIYMCVCVRCQDMISVREMDRETRVQWKRQSRERARREQIKRDLQRAHDLVLLTLDVLMHSMKYD